MGHAIFRYYVDFTWPEIATLERDLPLILPMGEGIDLEALSSRLGEGQQALLLPPFPYGWDGSLLTIKPEPLQAILQGLFESLHEEGWLRLSVAVGEDERLPALSIPILRVARRSSAHLIRPTEPTVVLIPIGHTEQHGLHLPLDTDTRIIEAIAQGVHQSLPETTTLLPVLPYGVSTHRSSFAGTLSVGGRAMEDFILAVLAELVRLGYDRLYLLNGHGGNHSFLVNAVKWAGERHPNAFCATSWLYLSSEEGARALQQLRRSPRGGMGHACELETSLMLHLCPDRVHMDRAVDETDFISTPDYFMDWLETGALIANPPWEDDTRTGAYGAPTLADAAHGSRWLEAAIAEKAALVREVHEQQERRQARRLWQP
jgi:creatinine amidohydrolase